MTVYIYRGYSGGGKSTRVREEVAAYGGIIVSRDLIRPQISGKPGKTVLDNAGESLVTKIETAQITAAVTAGVDVYVDNTNLVKRFADKYADLAVSLGTTFEVIDVDTSVATCKARNAQRAPEDQVPEHVIDRQAKRFPLPWATITAKPTPDTTPYVPDTSLPQAILVDLDGTLCLLPEGFSPYDPAHYPHDKLNGAVKEAIYMAEETGVEVIYFSGREGTASNRAATLEWLAYHRLHHHPLHMRPEGDSRNDGIVKQEMFNDHIRDNYNVLFALDDRDRVVKSYRDRGIPVFQTAYGDF